MVLEVTEDFFLFSTQTKLFWPSRVFRTAINHFHYQLIIFPQKHLKKKKKCHNGFRQPKSASSEGLSPRLSAQNPEIISFTTCDNNEKQFLIRAATTDSFLLIVFSSFKHHKSGYCGKLIKYVGCEDFAQTNAWTLCNLTDALTDSSSLICY